MKYIILLPLLLIGVKALLNLDVIYEWKEVTFAWPNETLKNHLISEGSYIKENNLPLGLALWRNKLFVTVPRWKSGVPASLTYIDLNTALTKSPNLTAYPNWKSHDLDHFSSETIVSPFRMAVDSCDRLWFVETGIADVLGDTKVYTSATVTVIDLTTDKIIHKYVLKDSDQTSSSFFANIVVDVDKDTCNDAYAYLTDLGGYGLVVYSLGQNNSWRFTHNFFSFEPLLGNLYIGGVNFQWNDGIFGAALGHYDQDGYRTFYFHPFVSYNEFSVNTRTLRNESLASNNNYYLWKHEGYKGPDSSSLVVVFDKTTNTLISSQPRQDGIGCWNPKKKLNPQHFHLVAQNHDTLVFPNDLKIDQDRNLWVLSDKLPVFQYSSLNPNELNFRILRAKVDDLLTGSGCVL